MHFSRLLVQRLNCSKNNRRLKAGGCFVCASEHEICTKKYDAWTANTQKLNKIHGVLTAVCV